MSREFDNALKRSAGQMDRQAGAQQKGILTSYNPNNYTGRVLLQPDNTLTGWLPVRCAMAGNGYGLVCGPVPGMQATIEPDQDDPGNYEITGFTFPWQGGVLPPPVPAGEIWAMGQGGSFIKLNAAGQAIIQDKAGSSIILSGDGTITVTCQKWVINAETSITETAGSAIELTATGIELNGAISGGAVGGGATTVTLDGSLTSTGDQVAAGISQAGHEHTSEEPGTPTSPPIAGT